MTSQTISYPGGIKTPRLSEVAPTEGQGLLSFDGVITPAAVPYYEGIVERKTGADDHLPTHVTTTTFALRNVTAQNPIEYYYQGKLVTVTTNVSCVLSTSDAGLHCIEFDADTGTLTNGGDCHGAFGIGGNAIVAVVLWNGTNYGLVLDERHGYSRNKAWHSWAHDVMKCQYVSGLTLTASGSGGSSSFICTTGFVRDEDIKFTIAASSAFPTAHTMRQWYQDSVSTYAFRTTASPRPFVHGANNRPNVVNGSTYALVELASAANRYANMFVYGALDNHTPLYCVAETVSAAIAADNGYASAALARAVNWPNLEGLNFSQEMRPLYRLVIRADGDVQAQTTADDYRRTYQVPLVS